MNLRLLIVLACTLLTVSACVVAPYGGREHGDHYRGDYGRRVWHE